MTKKRTASNHWLIELEKWTDPDKGNHVFLFSLPQAVIEQVGWKQGDKVIWKQTKHGYSLHKVKTK